MIVGSVFAAFTGESAWSSVLMAFAGLLGLRPRLLALLFGLR